LIKWDNKSGGGDNQLTRKQVRDHLVPQTTWTYTIHSWPDNPIKYLFMRNSS
jgi:hypothetical protein